MELLKMLMDQLGVSEDQAKGGAGLLFKMAKDKLAGEDFGKITEIVPGIEDLMSGAPKAGGGLGGALGGLASSLGGGKLGDLASLAAGFKTLGLDSSMVTKFAPIIMSFLQSKGGDSVQAILAKVMG